MSIPFIQKLIILKISYIFVKGPATYAAMHLIWILQVTVYKLCEFENVVLQNLATVFQSVYYFVLSTYAVLDF